MNTFDRLKRTFPKATDEELQRWLDAGRDHAAELDRLPDGEREAVAQLFACYGLHVEPDQKLAARTGITLVIAPWYPRARP